LNLNKSHYVQNAQNWFLLLKFRKNQLKQNDFCCFRLLKVFFLNIENVWFSIEKKQLSHLDQCQKPTSEHNKRFIT